MENIEELTYNKAVARLDAILAEMRGDSCDIDTLAEKTALALALLKHCKEKLFKADEEVRKCLDELNADMSAPA